MDRRDFLKAGAIAACCLGQTLLGASARHIAIVIDPSNRVARLFEAFAGSGRQIEIDMHAKGMDQKMIDIAVATGMPIKVSPKFSAEHMGLGYHQAGIRNLEWPPADASDKGIFALSNGSRRFLRYGYGDLFQEGKSFDVLFRLWPGTQHVLLMGDPATAASYGRASSFCGVSGLEIFEPLTFKGRQGSGIARSRCGYLDASLDPGKDDWQKYEYSYRVWGRCLYNPDTDAEVWKRFLRKSFDPQLFSSAVEFAQSLLHSHAIAKYSHADVAEWLEALADRSRKALAMARTQGPSTKQRAFRQLEEDVLIYYRPRTLLCRQNAERHLA